MYHVIPNTQIYTNSTKKYFLNLTTTLILQNPFHLRHSDVMLVEFIELFIELSVM